MCIFMLFPNSLHAAKYFNRERKLPSATVKKVLIQYVKLKLMVTTMKFQLCLLNPFPSRICHMVHVRLFYLHKTFAASSLACIARFLLELQIYCVKVRARAKTGKKGEGRRGIHRFFLLNQELEIH